MVEDCEAVADLMACQGANLDIVGSECWKNEGLTCHSSCITRAVVFARKHGKKRRCITFMSILD